MSATSSWDSLFASRPWGRYPPESVIRSVMRAYGNVPDRSAIRVLDLGCGPGACTWYLAREGFPVFGIDGSPNALERCTKRLNDEGLNSAELTAADLASVDLAKVYPEEFFDCVLDNASICCLDPLAMHHVAEGVARVLKPGGRIISVGFQSGTYHGGPLEDTPPVRGLCLEEVRHLWRAFDPLSIETTTYSLDDRTHEIKQWVVNGVKA